MPWALGVVPMNGGVPAVDTTATPYNGHVLVGQIGNWGAYLVSGTNAQLQALAALPNVYPICMLTQAGNVKWAELDNAVTAAMRTKLNTWLTNQGQATIPAGWTNRQIVMAVFKRFKNDYNLDDF